MVFYLVIDFYMTQEWSPSEKASLGSMFNINCK
jgi:hypothetical protein